MESRFAIGLLVLLALGGVALAQTPTPTPGVDSNVAVVTPYAQSRGQSFVDHHCSLDAQKPCNTNADCSPTKGTCVTNSVPVACTTQGNEGCGGCYPEAFLPDPLTLGQLAKVNPEWAPIGPMISSGPLSDPTIPPSSAPVLMTGTVALTKINVSGDFPASHITDDQNTFLLVDDAARLATGNDGSPSCPGEGCGVVEMEWEIGKYPLYAWAGEGDRVSALGRWIFDCGHPDPVPLGACSNNASRTCIVDSDCVSPGTCTNPAPVFNLRAELHPPQAVVVFRNNRRIPKSIPAASADVYISNDGGGAGDRCTVTHLKDFHDVLNVRECIQNHCSVTTDRSCRVDKDCAGGETCVGLDPAGRLANINASDFEFDMPLPVPNPLSAANATGLKIKTKSFKPKGGQMPKPTFGVTPGPTPNLHVTIPMSVPLSNGMMPNVFAQRITAGWIADTTALTRVQVKFKSLTINNPLKAATPAIPRKCTNSGGGFLTTDCTTNADCVPGVCNAAPSVQCYTNKDCAKTDFCAFPSICLGGINPGWEMFGEVNGDWVKFKKLETIGAAIPFAAPPYAVPSPTPLVIAEHFTFDEFVPSGGTIHLHSTGHSLNCIDTLYGDDLKDDLHTYGLTTGGACLQGEDENPGIINVTHTGPTFGATVIGATCGVPTSKGVYTCTTTSSDGGGGTCSTTTTRLCVEDADCPMGETCNITSGAFTLTYTIQVK